MPRRYGSKRRSGGRRSYGGSKRRPAARSAFFRSASRKRTAGWRWLLTGVLVGTVTTGMLYLNEHPLDDWHPIAAQTNHAKGTVQVAKAKPKYAFYRLLSKPTHAPETSGSSVNHFDKEVATSSAKSLNVQATSAPKQPRSQTLSHDSQAVYHLQLASFPRRADAIRMQHQLKASGINTNVEIAQVKGRVWYRVQSARFASTASASVLQQTLKRQGINSRLITLG